MNWDWTKLVKYKGDVAPANPFQNPFFWELSGMMLVVLLIMVSFFKQIFS